MFQIRKVKPEDIGFIIELAKVTGIYEGRLLENIESFLVCENDKALRGCGCLIIKGNRGYMNWVAISGEARREKLGSAVVKALLNIAEHKGVEKVYAPGICPGFLHSLGFEETSCCMEADLARDALGASDVNSIYEVSLEGYFKPCTH